MSTSLDPAELQRRCEKAEREAAAARAEAAALRAELEAVDDALDRLAEAAGQMRVGAGEIASSSQLVAGNAGAQASALEESTRSLEMITGTVRVNADLAQQADASAGAAKAAAGQGEVAIGQLGQTMKKIETAAEGTLAIIKEVNEIAFQTNLLALNAAVEAARAGDAGRGFAVVAEEVRSLALRSKAAATRTSELIEGSVREAGEGVRSMEQVAARLAEIGGMVARVTDVVGEIAASGQEQATELGRVTAAMEQVQSLTQSTAASSEQSSAAAAELSSQAQELTETLADLRGEEAPAPRAPPPRAVAPLARAAGAAIRPGAAARPAAARPVRRAVSPRTLGLSLPTQKTEQWVKAKITMLAQAKRLGLELRVELSECDGTLQDAQCRSLVDAGVGTLILTPHDAVASAKILEYAARAGVKVLAYDRLIVDAAQDFLYVAYDGTRVGELQGEHLTRAVPRGRYLLLHGPTTDHNAELFREGAMRRIGPLVTRGDVTVVQEARIKDYLAAEAKRVCAEVLKRGGKVDAVLAANDAIASGAIEALKAAGLAGRVPVTGLDAELAAAARIVQGTQTMTVFKDVRELAKRAVELAAALAAGKPVDTRGVAVASGRRRVPAVLLDPQAVTRENVDHLLIESGYLDRRAVYQGA